MGLLPDTESPTWQIIEYLQRHPAASIKELEEMLGVTKTAVRQHLHTLQAKGFVSRSAAHSGVGRPHYVYRITDSAQELFACHCDDLALTMLEEMFEWVGPERVSLLLERVSRRLADRYAGSVKSPLLQKRVEEMADVLGRQGVLTDVVKGSGDTIVLKTYNCPYHELAQEHREICEMDQQMLQQVLGTDIVLSSCIMDENEGCCSFVVQPESKIGLEDAVLS